MPPAVRTGSLLLAGTAVAALAMTVSTALAWRHFGPAPGIYRANGSVPRLLRGPLVVDPVVSVVTILFAWLAAAVRAPRRRYPQITTWVATLISGGVLFFALVTGFYEGTDQYVAPGWYPELNSVLGLVTLILMIAGALALSRSSVLDYYREASWQWDDRWSYFIAEQTKQDDD
jgi:hypothetical protein